jgi:hypothetical protein
LAGNPEALELILASGGHEGVNHRDAHGQTPLTHASAHGHLECCRLLLEAGADTAAVDSDGRTALMKASYGQHEHVVTHLLQAGANISHRDKKGGDAAAWAQYHDGILGALREQAAAADAATAGESNEIPAEQVVAYQAHLRVHKVKRFGKRLAICPCTVISIQPAAAVKSGSGSGSGSGSPSAVPVTFVPEELSNGAKTDVIFQPPTTQHNGAPIDVVGFYKVPAPPTPLYYCNSA